MKKIAKLLALSLPFFVFACIPPRDGESGNSNLTLVALGDSITMGIQDAGLLKDFQLNSYPYLIAQQMGAGSAFQQPYATSPGIGVLPYKEPLKLEKQEIIQTLWNPFPTQIELSNWIFPKLEKLSYPKPYNNLGVNGARLFDMRNTTSYLNSPDSNFFFDIVLRNSTPFPYPNFKGKTAVQEALLLHPDFILLWIGNNDILGSILAGCGKNGILNGVPFTYTSKADFESEYRQLLTDLKSGSTAHIVISRIPSYLPFANGLDGVLRNTRSVNKLCIFDPQTLAPIDFGQGVYLPLLLEETDATHLLLTGAIAYITQGTGIPSVSDLGSMGYGISAVDYISIMAAYGLVPPGSGTQLTGDLTMTAGEETTARGVIDDYNAVLVSLGVEFGVPVVDIIQSWWGNGLETPVPFGGYSGAYALQAQNTTTFSLDGVHPNNLGQALTANAFIHVLNDQWGLGIPLLNPDNFKGQYSGKSIIPKSLKAVERVREMLPLKMRY
jgi:lysophospholipase L1-like esterase